MLWEVVLALLVILHRGLAGLVQWLRLVLVFVERNTAGGLGVVADSRWSGADTNWASSPQQPAGDRGP